MRPSPGTASSAGRAAPEPFGLAVADELLDDLADRVRRTRWTDAIPGSGWMFGADAGYLRKLADYWVDGFDWRAQERLLNARLPGYITELDGRRLHFAHVPGEGPRPMPLVLLHGWPGSFAEMYKVAPLLAGPAAHGGDARDAFHVVVPSLPGHGFSDAVLAPGFGADECAAIVRSVMVDVLGYPSFGAQGGDRGAFVATALGHQARDHVRGIHLNLAGGIPARPPDGEEAAWLDDQARWLADEGGYIAIQSTRPQTLAFALNDSPVGLLAWVVEKWRAWSDCDGDPERCFTPDELLTNVTLYWVTGTIRSSMHWYLEHRQRPPVFVRPERVDVPTGVAVFPKEVMRTPRSAVARKYDLRHWTTMPRG
ncbi:MAG TPA: epoxide hydrolase, partial [Acidimicrobiales bacterium]|nr:epoxide hydrolase [Acidimicrobiales bacterium]